MADNRIQQPNPNAPFETQIKQLKEQLEASEGREALLKLENDSLKAPHSSVADLALSEQTLNFKQLLLRLTNEVATGKLTATEGAHAMATWFKELPSVDKEHFRANRIDAETTMQFYKNILETFSQQLPFLLVG